MIALAPADSRGAPRPARAGVAPLSEHAARGQRATNVVADRPPPPHPLPVGLAPVRHRADHASPSRTAIDADSDKPREESDPDQVRTVEHRDWPHRPGAQGSGQPVRCGGAIFGRNMAVSPAGAAGADVCSMTRIARRLPAERRRGTVCVEDGRPVRYGIAANCRPHLSDDRFAAVVPVLCLMCQSPLFDRSLSTPGP